MHINVVIYMRVSTADQETGLDTQLDVIQKKIKSVGYRRVIETFADEDVSGDSHVEERPAFKQMLEFIKKHNATNSEPIREVWVQSRDRTWRRGAEKIQTEKNVRNKEKNTGTESHVQSSFRLQN